MSHSESNEEVVPVGAKPLRQVYRCGRRLATTLNTITADVEENNQMKSLFPPCKILQMEYNEKKKKKKNCRQAAQLVRSPTWATAMKNSQLTNEDIWFVQNKSKYTIALKRSMQKYKAIRTVDPEIEKEESK